MGDTAFLERKRLYIQTQPNNFENRLVDYDGNAFELTNRLEQCKSLLEDFNKIQIEIDVLGETTDQNIEAFSNFETSYYKVISKGTELLQSFLTVQVHLSPPIQREISEPSDDTGVSNGINSSSSNARHIQLLEINLPKFSRDYRDWLNFRDICTSMIHENDAVPRIEKFYYLKLSLSGIAVQEIKSLDVSADNYNEAWNLLEKRFENKRIISQTHVSALFNLPLCQRESAAALRQLTNEPNQHVCALKSLGRAVDQWDDLLVHLITTKLDTSSRRAWEDSQKTTNIPKFETLLEFLNQSCHTLEVLHNSKVEHYVTRCQTFQGQSVEDIVKTVKTKKL